MSEVSGANKAIVCLPSTSKRRWIKAATSGAVLTAAGVFAFPFSSQAYQTIRVNGEIYSCQHTCMVHTEADGGYYVGDSGGGWVSHIKVNGGLIREPGTGGGGGGYGGGGGIVGSGGTGVPRVTVGDPEKADK